MSFAFRADHRMSAHKVANSIRMRQDPTPAELALVPILRSACEGVDRFGLQVPMFGFIADAYVHGARIVVEADGSAHDSRGAYDKKRDVVLLSHGILTLRFPNDRVLAKAEFVVHVIRRAIFERNPRAARLLLPVRD